jgi:two-component system chemotaxis response regulator CheY
MRILIVDASHAMRRVLTAILAHLGHADVVEAVNGPDGLHQLHRNPIGLIIADWNMAKMDIAEFIRHVRMASAAPVPILVVTTIAAGAYLTGHIADDRAVDHVVKPFTVGAIEDKIIALLRRASRNTSEAEENPAL